MTDASVDLLSLVLTLRPLADASGSNGMGRAAHALLLDAVHRSDAALAEELHTGDGLRPFTASNLIGYSPKRGLSAERTYTLRFTALARPVAGALLEQSGLAPATHGSDRGGERALCVGSMLRLDAATLRVEAVTCDPAQHPWAAATTYAALSSPWLLGRSTPERRLALEFNSPTTFRSRERHMPVPLPELVFGSLLDRWNAFAPIAFPAELRRYAEACLAMSAYRLRSHAVLVKDAGIRIGAVGWARYATLSYDRYWMSLIHLLAGYAFYAGVGAGTAVGMGQCRPITDSETLTARDAARMRGA